MSGKKVSDQSQLLDKLLSFKPFGGLKIMASRGRKCLYRDRKLVEGVQDVPIGSARMFIVENRDEGIPMIFEVFWSGPLGICIYPFVRDRIESKFSNFFHLRTEDLRECIGIAGRILFESRSKNFALLCVSHLWSESLPPFYKYAKSRHPEEAEKAYSKYIRNLKNVDNYYDTEIETYSLLWMVRVMREAIKMFKSKSYNLVHFNNLQENEDGDEESEGESEEILELAFVTNHEKIPGTEQKNKVAMDKSRIRCLKDTLMGIITKSSQVTSSSSSVLVGSYLRPILIEEDRMRRKSIDEKYGSMLEEEKKERAAKMAELKRKYFEEVKSLRSDEVEKRRERAHPHEFGLKIAYRENSMNVNLSSDDRISGIEKTMRFELEKLKSGQIYSNKVLCVNEEEAIEKFEEMKRKKKSLKSEKKYKIWLDDAQSVASNISLSIHEMRVEVFSQAEHVENSRKYKQREETDIGPRFRILEKRQDDHTQYLSRLISTVASDLKNEITQAKKEMKEDMNKGFEKMFIQLKDFILEESKKDE